MATRASPRPSTPLSKELYHGLQQVARHNALTQPHHPTRGRDISAAGSSTSALESSAHHHANIFPRGVNAVPTRKTDRSEHPTIFESIENQSYGADIYPIGFHGFPVYATQPTQDDRPQTPQSAHSDLIRNTRSGRHANRSSSPAISKAETSRSRTNKSPKSKSSKSRASSAVAAKTPRIDRPLSELTEGIESVPVRDMEAWVNRSASVRQAEVEKRNGYVTRPMNSFMLYRSAYAERTKQWCLQNNHQVVSSVSGESWPLEPQEVREHYNELARLERDNHAKAHPDYKFSPSKSGPSLGSGSRKKQKKYMDCSDDEDADESGEELAEDSDGEWRPRGGRSATRSVSNSGGRKQQLQQLQESHAWPPAYITDPMVQQLKSEGGSFYDSPQTGHPALMLHPSSWATGTSMPSSYDDFLQQDYLDNLSFFHGNGAMTQAETPYYITSPGAALPSNTAVALPQFYPGQQHFSQADLQYLHSHAGMGVAMPMHLPLEMEMATLQQQQQQHHQNMHGVPLAMHTGGVGMGMDTEMQHEPQVDPMLLQLDGGHGLHAADQGLWGVGGGDHFDEWMAGRDG